MIIGIDGNEANVNQRVGSGVYAFELLHEFSKNKKYEFVIYLKDFPLRDLPKESANFKYKIFGPRKLWTQFALPVKLSFGSKIDIFFTLGHYGPRFSQIPYSITIFDLSYLRFPELFKKSDLYQLTNWSKYSIRSAKHIFTISYATKTDIIKNYKIDDRKISVTYPGYDQKGFKPQSKSKIEKVRNKYKVKDDYILFVGTLQPRKNVERLIEAFKKVTQLSVLSSWNLQLVIAGKNGWLYESIFEKVKSLKLEKEIIFTDYVPDDELPALISGAKVFVLPSLWEGFGIPVVEAQACGVPVAVSDTSSLPEIVRESGVLVNPGSIDSVAQGIRKVLTDEKFRQNLIKKGFVNIKRFSWQKCANETLETLEKLASNRIL